MTAGLVTIAIVPGERFSVARRSLESVLAQREPSTELVYIDAGSPPLVRQYLEQKASRHGVRLISTERHMAPNEARNLAAAQVRTKYVAFVDNDVLVSPGWLDALLDCAESTGAWIVGPLCLDRDGAGAKVVDAGGSAEIFERNGRREFHQFEFHRGMPLADVAHKLLRRRLRCTRRSCGATCSTVSARSTSSCAAPSTAPICACKRRTAGGKSTWSPKRS
jgi:glycosyltransferase involved in cell wall biosynthesis